MAYEKITWTAGDVITAEKLNHLEGGVEEAANRPVFVPEIVAGEGDVSITYKGDQIGVLSDSGTLTLETKDTICEDDIEVEYTKPSGGNNFPSVTVNDTTESLNAVVVLGGIYNSNGEWLTFDPSELISHPTNFIPLYNSKTGYYANITVDNIGGGDSLIVIANNQPISYDAGNGVYLETHLPLATYDTPLTINISSKPVQETD